MLSGSLLYKIVRPRIRAAYKNHHGHTTQTLKLTPTASSTIEESLLIYMPVHEFRWNHNMGNQEYVWSKGAGSDLVCFVNKMLQLKHNWRPGVWHLCFRGRATSFLSSNQQESLLEGYCKGRKHQRGQQFIFRGFVIKPKTKPWLLQH